MFFTSVRQDEPLGEYLSRVGSFDLISEYTSFFNLVIRLSKVEQMAFFRFLPCWMSLVEQLAAVSGFNFGLSVCIAGSRGRGNLLFPTLLERVLSS